MLERPERFNQLLDDFVAAAPNTDVSETSAAARPAGDPQGRDAAEPSAAA